MTELLLACMGKAATPLVFFRHTAGVVLHRLLVRRGNPYDLDAGMVEVESFQTTG
jgi:hypothetical protein